MGNTYQWMDACNNGIKHKNEEHLIILMPHTIIYPYTMVILYQNQKFSSQVT